MMERKCGKEESGFFELRLQQRQGRAGGWPRGRLNRKLANRARPKVSSQARRVK